MNDRPKDIGDDEIRIISSESKETSVRHSAKKWIWWPVAAVILLIVGAAAYFVRIDQDPEGAPEPRIVDVTTDLPVPTQMVTDTVAPPEAYTAVKDTTVSGVELTILSPCNATPLLVVGNSALQDSTAVLVAQAADVRGDNGMIAGAFVVKGELMSKGEAKAGFCSIVNDEVTVGVADATPMLEQALMQEGYFFRQYPLVVGGQLVENKPKGRAVRKALAELDGRICVIVSRNRMTFHDFAQALIDLGVRNAIYLVGAESCGFYVDGNGEKISFGYLPENSLENVNYIVWRQR